MVTPSLVLLGAWVVADVVAAAGGSDAPHVGVVVAHGPVERRMRGDFERPDALLLAFRDDWADELAPILAATPDVPTYILVDDDEPVARARGALDRVTPGAAERPLEWVPSRVDSPWVRDYGPLPVELHGSPLWLDAHYYDDRPDDDAVPSLLGEKARVDVEPLPFPFEGGAIVSNGHGLCASTTTSAERAGIDVDDRPLTDHLLAALGCRAWAMLPPLDGEDTGHADMFVQFTSTNRVVVGDLDEARSPVNAARLDEAVTILERAARATGSTLHVTRVPLWFDDDGELLSWVNGVRVGERFLVPTFAHAPRDVEERALARITSAVAPLTVVRVHADEIAALGGALHCATLGIELGGNVSGGPRRPRASRTRSAPASWALPHP